MNEIGLIQDIKPLSTVLLPKKTVPADQENAFGAKLIDAFKEVNKLHQEADEASVEMAAGKNKDIHKTMIAIEKADISFQLMMQVRNKVISAYETIMRMQV